MKNSIIKNMLLIFVLLSTANFAVSQNSNVWGSVKNLSELEKSSTYLTAAKKLNIKYKQALPSSKKPHLLKVYEFSCNCNEADLYTALNNVSAISGIEYGPKYEPLVLPDDYTMNFNPMWSLDLINAEGAWDYTHGDPNIVAAVSDQNYYVNHEELLGKVVYYDPMNNSSQGHGTAVATLVAGNTNNDVGMSSIGYDIKLGLYRMNYNEVLDASYAGARVINLSWTSGCAFNQYQQAAITEVYDNGTFIVAAAGNGSTCGGPDSLVYPAAYDNVFSVTSIGPYDNHERTIGDPTSTHQHNITVDLNAPGYDVPITAAPGWYLTGNGTSYASPIVAGTVGLMVSVNPCLSNLEIETYLKQSSVDIDLLNPNYAGLIGAGRLNAEGAVQLAANSITTDPSFSLTDFCEGEDNLASNIATPGGTFSFDALPSSGESINSTTGEITGGISGTTYTIKYVTAGLCSSSTTQTVTVNSLPIVSAGTNQSVCNDGTTVTLIGSGATTYVWDNGVTDGASFTPIETTTFNVRGTDANGCSNTDQVDVTVNDLPVVSAGTDQSVCNDGTTVTLKGSGATTYVWDNGVTDGASFTPIETTTFNATGTDANGCSNTDQVDVTVNDLPVVSAGTDQSVCNDGTTVTLIGSGATTYVWDNGVTDGISFTPPLAPPVFVTTYTVTGTDTNGCSNTDQVYVRVNKLPEVLA
ncbi:S8 family serine peptidase, partial [bacterium]|nr:S8 family serine peptidase [bacterium]